MYKKQYRPTGPSNCTKKAVSRTKNTALLERDAQALLFEWADWAVSEYPELALCYHIPNGGSRNAREAHNLKLQGVRAGVPDICLPVPRGIYGALYIELKRAGGGRVSEKQRAWIDALNRAGNRAVVCRGFEEARDAIIDYLSAERRANDDRR